MTSTAPEPRRIQLSRACGWRLADQSDNAVIVDRRTVFGNPYAVRRLPRRAGWEVRYIGTGGWAVAEEVIGVYQTEAEALDVAIAMYRKYVQVGGLADRIRRDLGGRDLACWCRRPQLGEPDRCHAGAVLLPVAAGRLP